MADPTLGTSSPALNAFDLTLTDPTAAISPTAGAGATSTSAVTSAQNGTDPLGSFVSGFLKNPATATAAGNAASGIVTAIENSFGIQTPQQQQAAAQAAAAAQQQQQTTMFVVGGIVVAVIFIGVVVFVVRKKG